MRCNKKNQREIKSGFEGLSGMVSKFAKLDPHVLSGKTGHWELLDQTNNLAHYSK